MFPDFMLFGRAYPTYNAIGVAALIIGAAVAALRLKRYGFRDMDVIYSTTFAGIGLLLGGVALHFLVHRTIFGGMVFYGGLFGAFLGLWVFSKAFKRDFGNILCFFIPVMPLTHGIMRLACFAAGCCHGIVHNTLGIAFTRSVSAPNGIPFLPVPLYEAAMNLIIFAILWQFSKKERKPLHLLCLYVIPYAAGRFALEFLRGDAVRGTIFIMSTSQFISILVALACIVALIYSNFVKRKNTTSGGSRI